MSGADFFSNDAPISPYYDDERTDISAAQRDHATTRAAFESAGIDVVKVDPPNDSQDGVYTANWALVHGDKAIVARLPNARKTEENYAAKILTTRVLTPRVASCANSVTISLTKARESRGRRVNRAQQADFVRNQGMCGDV
jgi:N-dimethylarginine dimethylaminohydrolase